MTLRKAPNATVLDSGALDRPTWYTDLTFRDQRELMERPFFSLSKRPRFDAIEYHFGDVSIVVNPGKDRGLATIWDADILIWAATEIMALKDAGKPVHRKLDFHPRALLRAIGRHDGRSDYACLEEALRRLHSTAISTTIRAAKRYRRAEFHWIETWERVIREDVVKANKCSLTLSTWMFEGIIQKGGVLAIHKDYFLLTGGLERWLYRIARKHGGTQPEGWSLTMSQLYQKSGSQSRRSNFCLQIRKIVKDNSLPDYHLSLITPIGGEETLIIAPRYTQLGDGQSRFEFP